MAAVLERLRVALAPDYELERELGGGGMGVVFLARDPALDRRVAIKVIRPELATARATERFLREAKLLAQLKHPNIMPVHRAGEAGGFAYYVMDYCEGETLEDRFARGPLSRGEAVRIGRDLLDGLDAVHRAGLIHRDVKPSNVFLVDRRAVLGDFGLALTAEVGTTAPTEPGGFVGTPGYTPPEQGLGGAVTPRTDLYAVGMVLYEALKGRRWVVPEPGGPADWSGIPRALRYVLRRGLAWSPERRWPDAASFRRAWTSAERGQTRRRMVAAASVLAATVAAWLVWPPPPDGSARRVRVRAFESLVAGRPSLGDSLALLVAAELSGSPDYVVVGPRDRTRRAAVELRGEVRAADGVLCAGARLQPRTERFAAFTDVCAPGEAPTALADSLARFAMVALWTADQPLLADLPRSAMPRTPWGVAAWVRAERLFNQGRWGDAKDAYLAAEQADSSCALCLWRLYFVEKWTGVVQHDEDRFRRFVAHIDQFPPQYQSVMRASALPMAQRLDSLRRATELYRDFFFAWWFYGEEQFHRAPLTGRWRHEALESFIRASALSPDFAPGWEHLAFAATAEGDSAWAARALSQWAQAMGGPPRDPYEFALRAQVESAFAWRFTPAPNAEAVTGRALLRPEVRTFRDLPAGARHMPMLDVPRGAVWLGHRFAEIPGQPDLQRSGLLAQAFGYTALGRLDSARASLDELLSRFPEQELDRFAAEFMGTVAYLDPDGLPAGALSPRASSTLAVLAGRSTAQPGELDGLLRALEVARAARWGDALAGTDSLVADPARDFTSQVLRALLHFARAEWFGRLGDAEAARRALRWAEHWEVDGFPTQAPQAAEVDWSLRTLARWRLATSLDAAGVRDREVCLAFVRVADAWAGGEPVFRARADSARRRAAQLSCQPGR
jgi:hypothetical protein